MSIKIPNETADFVKRQLCSDEDYKAALAMNNNDTVLADFVLWVSALPLAACSSRDKLMVLELLSFYRSETKPPEAE